MDKFNKIIIEKKNKQTEIFVTLHTHTHIHTQSVGDTLVN